MAPVKEAEEYYERALALIRSATDEGDQRAPKAARERNEFEGRACLHLGEIAIFVRGDLNEARLYFDCAKSALEKASDHPKSDVSLWDYFQVLYKSQAAVYIEQKNIDGAYEAISEAIELDRKDLFNWAEHMPTDFLAGMAFATPRLLACPLGRGACAILPS